MELHIRNVSKTYPNGTQALKGVSLDVPQGMFGLLGPNGAGKSTLMRIVATLLADLASAVHAFAARDRRYGGVRNAAR